MKKFEFNILNWVCSNMKPQLPEPGQITPLLYAVQHRIVLIIFLLSFTVQLLSIEGEEDCDNSMPSVLL